MVVARTWGGEGNEELLFSRIDFQFCKMKNFHNNVNILTELYT